MSKELSVAYAFCLPFVIGGRCVNKMMHPMFNSCCPDLLVNISTEYPELVGYQGLYHPMINETTGRGGKIKK